MDRYICIHGHFYQPPGENPWLQDIGPPGSAYLYHNWNERVAAARHPLNATFRILGSDGCIARIVSNYSKISFDFGPTLPHSTNEWLTQLGQVGSDLMSGDINGG